MSDLDFLFIERDRVGKESVLHVWFGRLGFHLWWPNFWSSRIEWASER